METVACKVETCGNYEVQIEPPGPFAMLCGVCGEWIVTPEEVAHFDQIVPGDGIEGVPGDPIPEPPEPDMEGGDAG